ncbi:MAG TPA: ATP-binding protein [Myxococcales bacterium]|jgi:signal transduction histidine kinase|nr:ATP-binding protein [Myxococcales bacterium]
MSSQRRVLLIGGPAGRVATALSPLQLRLTTALSGHEALASLGQQDLVMIPYPEQLTPYLAAAAHVPVLVLDTPPGLAARVMAEGALDTVPPGVDGELLRAKVTALLRLKATYESGRFEASERAALVAQSAEAVRRAELQQQEAEKAQARAEAARRDAEHATRLKDQFLATLSHEMRTPLTSILGWVRLMRLGQASAEPSGRPLETIERNAQVQARLVSDLLDVQRMTSGKMSLSFVDVEMGAAVEAAVHGLQRAAEEAGVRLRLLRPGDEELRVFGDPERLHQIISSLLSNAIKFSSKGGEVKVQLTPTGTELLLAIGDEGRGIDPGFLPHAFEPFRQEEQQLSREKGGLGLGLSIVRHLVEQHGGSVNAESDGSGQGARFTVSLPLRSRRAKASAPPPPSPVERPRERHDLQGVRVLVVEDDVDTQYLLTALLEQFGARVTAASSVAQAMTCLEGAPFDLILSDISMPGEDGYSFIRRVRKGTVQQLIPAVALTANARTEDKTRAFAAGFQLHIAKPVDPADLVHKVATLLGQPR